MRSAVSRTTQRDRAPKSGNGSRPARIYTGDEAAAGKARRQQHDPGALRDASTRAANNANQQEQVSAS
ncbi:hypothetical protein OHA72_38890 [Dactylosporangium sp. NBC_01737]|uniref:hypothetical protein n=1 Tax=Dactylosporangium sp. NBC_01737 TaxID=2975959 RepID=UPI002E0F70E1|nr:hypothetical protein OHA72_38890 [Dactylosporangium sp. NBC_01737]